MSATNFPASLAAVLLHEGGYVNNPRDPGGPTNKGVTQKVYDNWRASHGLPLQTVRNISEAEVEAIYFKLYWNTCHCDDLPAGVDYAMFDFAVNSGPHEADVTLQRAIQALQAAAGVVVDGVIGPKTIAAVNASDPVEVIKTVCDDRLTFMREHCDWADFSKGWTARVTEVEQDAKAMAA